MVMKNHLNLNMNQDKNEDDELTKKMDEKGGVVEFEDAV